jgi:hypothetical protein
VRLALALAALVLTCGVIAGCASTGLEGNVYRGDGYAFRLEPPKEGWEQLDAGDAVLAFRDDGDRAIILVHARCGVDGDDVPLVALTNHLFLEFTEREIEKQEVVPFDGREAMHTLLTAKLDGVLMRYEVWVLKKDECVYDMLYLAPPATFEHSRAAFTALVRGFSTKVEHDD